MQHNDVRDLTSELLTEVYHNVKTEPILTPLTGKVLPEQTITEDGARCICERISD